MIAPFSDEPIATELPLLMHPAGLAAVQGDLDVDGRVLQQPVDHGGEFVVVVAVYGSDQGPPA
jgi:hypothetical protein